MSLVRQFVLTASLITGSELAHAQADVSGYPDLKRVFTADTLPLVTNAQVSPDGRWIVMAGERGANGSALFLGKMGTNELMRLTNDGNVDELPLWFPSSDRIAFVSNRPARNGSTAKYGMVLDIDSLTGAPRGAPRQVTLDSAFIVQPSPDGQWLAVATAGRPNKLLLVPALGGNARTLLEANRRAVSMGFSPDGKSIFYRLIGPNSGPPSIERLALEPGAKPEQLLAPSKAERYLLPADQRYALHWIGTPSEWKEEVRTLDGRLIGSHSVPKQISCPWHTYDGWGWVCVEPTGGLWTTRLLNTDGRPARDIPTPNLLTVGWWPDGSALVSMTRRKGTDGKTTDYVDVVPLNGGPVRSNVFEPSDATGPVVGHEVAYRVTSRNEAGVAQQTRLVAMDLRNGNKRTLSEDVMGFRFSGPSGNWSKPDRFYWGERDGQAFVLYGAPPGRAKVPLRRFSLETDFWDIRVHGQRVMWLERSRDSVNVLIADNATAPPRKLVGYRARPEEISGIAWSRDGSRVAISHHIAGQSSAISVFSSQVNGTVPKPQTIPISVDLKGPTWLGDATIGGLSESPGKGTAFVTVSLASGRSTVVHNDPLDRPVNAVLSPDGKQVALSVAGRSGGSVLYTFVARRIVQEAVGRGQGR